MFPEYNISRDDAASKIEKKDPDTIYQGAKGEKARLFMSRITAICKYSNIALKDSYASEWSMLATTKRKLNQYERVLFCVTDDSNDLYALTDYRIIINNISFDLL